MGNDGATTTAMRPFGFWMATALVVGSMIGSGVFALPAQLAPYGMRAIAGWAVAIGGALVLAQVLAGLARARPDATGAVAICGAALGPLPGVLVGWSYWVSIWSANAIIALTAVRYLAVLVPPLRGVGPNIVGAVALLWLMVGLNLRGARVAGRFQTTMTALKLLPLVAVIALLAGLAVAGRLSAPAPLPDAPPGLAPIVTLAFFALVGFETASVAAERVRDPQRTVARATLVGTGLTGLLYLVLCSGLALALPPAVLAASEAPIALFVDRIVGRGAGQLLAGFAALAAIGALNGWVLLMGEVPLGMARARLLPGWIGRTSRRDVPVLILGVAACCASLLLLGNLTRSAAGALDFMLRVTTAATLWLYAGACLAALVLRVARPAAVVGLAFVGWALWGSGPEALGYSIALMLTALPLYLLRPRA